MIAAIIGILIVLFSFISIWYGSNGYVAIGVFMLIVGTRFNEKNNNGDFNKDKVK